MPKKENRMPAKDSISPRNHWDGKSAVRKSVPTKVKIIDPQMRTIRFVVSTGVVDRDGDVINPKGWRLERYKKNPVVLWAHDSRQPPIAKCNEIFVDGNALLATAQFMPRDISEFSDSIFRMYEGGFLRAVSAGFMPMEMEPRFDETTGMISGFQIHSAELWEFSAVPIPSNPEALVSAQAKGINTKPCFDWIDRVLSEDGMEAPEAELLLKSWTVAKRSIHPVQEAALARANGFIKSEEPELANELPRNEVTGGWGDEEPDASEVTVAGDAEAEAPEIEPKADVEAKTEAGGISELAMESSEQAGGDAPRPDTTGEIGEPMPEAAEASPEVPSALSSEPIAAASPEILFLKSQIEALSREMADLRRQVVSENSPEERIKIIPDREIRDDDKIRIADPNMLGNLIKEILAEETARLRGKVKISS